MSNSNESKTESKNESKRASESTQNPASLSTSRGSLSEPLLYVPERFLNDDVSELDPSQNVRQFGRFVGVKLRSRRESSRPAPPKSK